MSAFFQVIVGYDTKKKLLYRSGGLFGVLKAFFGTIETQNSGTFHMHCILYIAGFPATSSSFRHNCEDVIYGQTFQAQLRELLDSVVTSSIPACSSSPAFPACKNRRVLEPLSSISEAAYRLRNSNQKSVAIFKYTMCGDLIGGTQVMRKEVQLLREKAVSLRCDNLIPLCKNAKKSDIITDAYLSIPLFAETSTYELYTNER